MTGALPGLVPAVAQPSSVLLSSPSLSASAVWPSANPLPENIYFSLVSPPDHCPVIYMRIQQPSAPWFRCGAQRQEEQRRGPRFTRKGYSSRSTAVTNYSPNCHILSARNGTGLKRAHICRHIYGFPDSDRSGVSLGRPFPPVFHLGLLADRCPTPSHAIASSAAIASQRLPNGPGDNLKDSRSLYPLIEPFLGGLGLCPCLSILPGCPFSVTLTPKAKNVERCRSCDFGR